MDLFLSACLIALFADIDNNGIQDVITLDPCHHLEGQQIAGGYVTFTLYGDNGNDADIPIYYYDYHGEEGEEVGLSYKMYDQELFYLITNRNNHRPLRFYWNGKDIIVVE